MGLDMTKRYGLILGAALLAAGLVRMYFEAQATGTLLIPGCLGNDFVVHVETPVWARLHCWGCYSAALGAMTLIGAFFSSFPRQARLTIPFKR